VAHQQQQKMSREASLDLASDQSHHKPNIIIDNNKKRIFASRLVVFPPALGVQTLFYLHGVLPTNT
jgi:hypothetical protein